jgi:hypothetical protein
MAAAAAMGEDHDAAGPIRQGEAAVETDAVGGNVGDRGTGGHGMSFMQPS